MAYKKSRDGLCTLHVHAPLSRSHDLCVPSTNWPTTPDTKKKRKKEKIFSMLLDTIRCTVYISRMAWCPAVSSILPSITSYMAQTECTSLWSLKQTPPLSGAERQMAESAESPLIMTPLQGLQIYIDLSHNEKVSLACSHVVLCLLCVYTLACRFAVIWAGSGHWMKVCCYFFHLFWSFFPPFLRGTLTHTVKYLISQGLCIKE